MMSTWEIILVAAEVAVLIPGVAVTYICAYDILHDKINEIREKRRTNDAAKE